MILFLIYPFFELLSLVFLGRQIGFPATVLYLLASFFVGVNFIRSAGFNTLKMASPQVVLEAPFRLMAGLLILIPGLVSDFMAVLILIPWVRRLVWTYGISRFLRGRVFQTTWQYQNPRGFGVEGEVVDVSGVREERDVTPQGEAIADGKESAATPTRINN